MKTFLSALILNVGFYFLFLVGSAVLIPAFIIIVTLQAPFRSHRNSMRLFRNLIKVYGKVVIKFTYPWVRIDYEDLVQKESLPCIYICNHRAASDAFLMAFLPGEIVQVVNTWPFRLPVLGFFARCAGYLSIREIAIETFYEKGKTLLDQGVSLAVFPEGTRSEDGSVGPFHSAAFRLALQCAVPLVPVCLVGNERIPEKGTLKLMPGLIRIRRLNPLFPEVFQNMSPFKLKSRVREILIKETAQMEACA